MQKILITIILSGLIFIISPKAEAKRAAPKPVNPVTYKGVTYKVTDDFEFLMQKYRERETPGRDYYIDACDAKTGTLLWRLKIYETPFDLKGLETDIQDAHITRLSISWGKLIIENEMGQRFTVDIENKHVLDNINSSLEKLIDKKVTLAGIPVTHKQGCALYNGQYVVYVPEIKEWPENILGYPVTATGTLQKQISARDNTMIYILKNVSWKLNDTR